MIVFETKDIFMLFITPFQDNRSGVLGDFAMANFDINFSYGNINVHVVVHTLVVIT